MAMTRSSFEVDEGVTAPRLSGAQRLSMRVSVAASASGRTASRMSVATFAMGGELGEGLVEEAMRSKDTAGIPAASSGLTFTETVANFVIGLVGAGVLVLPKMMADVGYGIAVALLLVAALAVCQCALMIIPCCEAAESCSGGPLASYEALASAALGDKGKLALAVTKNCYMLGVIIVYALLVVDGLGTWVPLDSSTLRWCVVLPVFVLLAMLKDLKQIARLAPLGICAAFVQAGSIVAGSFVHMVGGHQSPKRVAMHEDLNLLSLGSAAATAIFGFGSLVCTVPAVRAQMASREQLAAAVRWSLVIVWAIYLSVMGIGYASFGSGVLDNVLNSITNDCSGFQCMCGSVAALAIIINLLVSMPSMAFFVISVIEASGSGPLFTPLTYPNITLRASLMVSIVAISSTLPFVKQVIGLISASFGCINAFVYPLMLHYSLKRVRPEMLASGPLISLAHILVVGVGSVAIIFGITGSLDKLLSKIAEEVQQAKVSVAVDMFSTAIVS